MVIVTTFLSHGSKPSARDSLASELTSKGHPTCVVSGLSGFFAHSTRKQKSAPSEVLENSPECLARYLGRLNSTPRSSFNLVVASRSSEDSGIFVARCSLKIHSVGPTMA
jgi:hypothetical protein